MCTPGNWDDEGGRRWDRHDCKCLPFYQVFAATFCLQPVFAIFEQFLYTGKTYRL